ncbi:hypothetical protein ACFYWU_39380 [Streptomyces chrestomyceticus]|uniref:hypothetical protein n=1 Tax=Streptomyces chrestomyceticus TaxID=68185 RepID=UPI00367CAF1F
MESFESVRLDAYFSKNTAQFAPTNRAMSFLVTHLLSERPAFVRAVTAMGPGRHPPRTPRPGVRFGKLGSSIVCFVHAKGAGHHPRH